MKKKPSSEFDGMSFCEDTWRVLRITSEFVEGFEALTLLGPSVSFFGSNNLESQTPEYDLAFEVATKIAKKGFSVITGGGPGLMEAANRGAQAAGGKSCGLWIDVPFEKATNSFVDPDYRLKFRYFFVRKVMFVRYAQGYVFLPGGFGTLDELFEALTLIQTEKIQPFPIYLLGKKYWEGLLDWILKGPIQRGCLQEKDLKLLNLTDDTDQVADGIERHYKKSRTMTNF